ncbi:MAG: T9SS type B sorting domain-containing protein, partial [Saprospiraceae bacterium]|nr:T9SS type B sorting domain-containing protein [Saprospiraceae bacterium]
MKKYNLMNGWSLFLLAFSTIANVQAQAPTIQDCLGAIPICQPVYREDKVVNGMGNYPNEITFAISCLEDERNAIWYTFTVNNTGNFGFTLTPNNLNDDYDWALYDLTDATCEEIRTNPNLLVSCNAAGKQGLDLTCIGVTGATGASSHNIQGLGCGNNPPNLHNGLNSQNALIPVERGNTYVLVVSNWSRSTNGYTIDFGVSAGIGIFDLEDPEVSEATFPEQCGDNSITITFNENIQCSTIDKFNFILDGPGGPYAVRLLSPVCELGGRYTKTFDLLIEPAIQTPGSFTLNLDGDRSTEVLDLCNNPAFNTSLSFEVTIEEQLPLELGNDQTICPGSNVTLDASVSAPNAEYQWSNGATSPTITVAEAGTYLVTVTAGCARGTDLVSVEVRAENNLNVDLGDLATLCPNETLLLDATNVGANYRWQDGSTNPTLQVNRAGTYAVTVTNECGSVSDEVVVQYLDEVTLDLGEDFNLCLGVQKVLNADIGAVSYSWQDGSTDATFKVQESGLYTVAATTSCGILRDSVLVIITDLPQVDLGDDRQLCEGTSITLNAAASEVTYLWSDGSINATFTTDVAGTYQVTLSNECGVASDTIRVEVIPDFTITLGDDQLLCEGNTLDLEIGTQDINIRWQDGSTNSNLIVSSAGIYWVQAQNECFTHTDSVLITAATSPTIDLGDDRLLCPDETIELDASHAGAQYLWQDGSIDSVYTITAGGMYMVTVTNACGSAVDMVQVNTIPKLRLDLGADTLLCRGEQYILDAGQSVEVTYVWQDGSSKSKFIANEPGLYTVQVTNECEALEDDILFVACPVCEMYVPNAFSPNLDNQNDVFLPFPSCVMNNYLLQIFDRWGTLVFASTDPSIGWDGIVQNQSAPNGV